MGCLQFHSIGFECSYLVNQLTILARGFLLTGCLLLAECIFTNAGCQHFQKFKQGLTIETKANACFAFDTKVIGYQIPLFDLGSNPPRCGQLVGQK